MSSSVTPRQSGRSASRALVLTASLVSSTLALTACAAEAPAGDALPAVSFQTSWTPNVQFGGSYLADDLGYYEEAGVDVEILGGGPEVNSIPLVESGEVLVGVSNADYVARANAEGADLVIVGAGFQKNPFAVLSLSENPISEPADMEGMRIGVPSGDTATLDALVAVNDLDGDAITVVPVGYDIAPLTSGEVDGIIVFYTDQPVALELAGFEGETFLMADYGLDVFAQVYFVSRESLETRRDEVVAFMTGELAGWNAYLDDPDAAAQLTIDVYAKDVGLLLEAQQLQAQRQLDLLLTPSTEANGLFWMSEEDIEKNLDAMATLGVTGVSAALFDNSILEEIHG